MRLRTLVPLALLPIAAMLLVACNQATPVPTSKPQAVEKTVVVTKEKVVQEVVTATPVPTPGLPPLNGAAQACVDCHRKETPQIVADWAASTMAQANVDCIVCHGDKHTKGAEDAKQATLPSPETCNRCHPDQFSQYMDGKHSKAWTAMMAMPMIGHQPAAVYSGQKGCGGCHNVGIKSEEDIKALGYGGNGCISCHTRHKFSVKEAKKPEACMTCHMGFDHPQWEMWSSSKHGAIYRMEGDAGRAPTCQRCHMPNGDHAVKTAWGFLGLRLPEKDDQWMAARVEILKGLGVLDKDGNPTARLDAVKAADVARLTAEDWQTERDRMIKVCTQCHARSFAESNLKQADEMLKQADFLMAEAIRTVAELYDDGYLQKPEGWNFAPDLLQFYEAKTPIEQKLYTMFLEYRMRTFQGSYHLNPDYAHWYGWAQMKETLTEIKDEAARIKKEAK
jgi:hypothetical protein